ncbi:MAG: hypothetical protein ACOYU4_08225 [Thermodesulfobacteriota bacterium]
MNTKDLNKLSGQIVAAAVEVHKALGLGLPESDSGLRKVSGTPRTNVPSGLR